jgi:hypothetical protein
MELIWHSPIAATSEDSFGGWLLGWIETTGFAGAAAVLAAVIAFSAAWHQANVQRQAQRKEQWWKRAEWALNLTLSDDTETRTVGFQTLTALSESEWAAEHEGDVIAAATDRTLDEVAGNSGVPRFLRREWRARGRRGGR